LKPGRPAFFPGRRNGRIFAVHRLTCLLLLGAALAAGPVLAKVTGVPDTVAVVSPPLSTLGSSKDGCTPINPCATLNPALGSAPLPTPETPPQPDLPANDAAPEPAPAAASPCPPAGARGEGFRRFAQAGPRNGGAEGGRGFGGGIGEAGRQPGGAFRGGFARGGAGCPRPQGGQPGSGAGH